jgi:hypothetical protein
VDEQKDEGHYEPDYWESVKDALEKGFQRSVHALTISLDDANICHPERSELG